VYFGCVVCMYVCVSSDCHVVIIWPSGLRRQFKALVRKGVGSNPTMVNFLLLSYSTYDNKLYQTLDAMIRASEPLC
jgi:hypothetical protein